MKNHCKKNPCCGNPYRCTGSEPEISVVSTPPLPPMTAERAIFILEYFKREEKLLGPNEQKALDFAIDALRQAPPPIKRDADATN